MSVIDPELLKILCCPETRQSVAEANETVLTAVNQKIAAGTAKNVAGKVVSEKLEAALLRQDGRLLYPIRNRIPIMLVDEGIEVS